MSTTTQHTVTGIVSVTSLRGFGSEARAVWAHRNAEPSRPTLTAARASAKGFSLPAMVSCTQVHASAVDTVGCKVIRRFSMERSATPHYEGLGEGRSSDR
ncbi:MAG: hypothetical protein Q8Q09_24975 [Deltaproteobacteria bacterium]|nr:hypothetical protein [Deltaproteobacteria bacterium]